MAALDPRFRALLEQARPNADRLKAQAQAQARAAHRGFWRFAHGFERDAPAMLEVRPLEVAGAAGPLPARLYVPFAAGLASPLLVFFHGGGFISGSLDSHEMICRRLADAGRLRVLSVAYRLAPDHKWPAAPDDAAAATRWALANAAQLGANAARVAVGGDSAGGNLAAVTALAMRGEAQRPAAQLLIYPCTQLVRLAPTRLALKESHGLVQAAQDWVRDLYLPARDDAYDWRVSPLLAPDHRGLPPALVLTAGLDPLEDEGRAYADRLAASGVGSTHRSYPDQLHGFFNITALSPTARAAAADSGRWLARTLGA